MKMTKKITVCITGDIDHFKSETVECMDAFFSVLEKYNVKSEIFITAKAALDFPDRLQYIIERGHEIGGHGDVHEAFYEGVIAQTKRIEGMKNTFFKEFGLSIRGFRAPWYKHNRYTYQALDNAGMKYDCSLKRFEIAFKRVPYFQEKYMFTGAYTYAKPFLKAIGGLYNKLKGAHRYPFRITKNVVEFPTLGISDYTLIDAPAGPKFQPSDAAKIAEIWIECLKVLNERGGGVITIQAHPGRLSPAYLYSLDLFISQALKFGASFSTPQELSDSY